MTPTRLRHRHRPLDGAGQPGPAGKQLAILADLRAKIVARSYPPGSRLPTRAQLSAAYEVSPLTVQWALKRLAVDGLVQARGRHGTFVVDYPPHLHRIGLATEFDPRQVAEFPAGQLASVLYQAFSTRRSEAGDSLPTYTNLREQDTRDWNALLADLRDCRLAGLISDSPHLGGNELFVEHLRRHRVPWIVISSGMSPYPDHVHQLVLSHEQMLMRAVDVLVSRGRRQLACMDGGYSVDLIGRVSRYAAKRGARILPQHWVTTTPSSAPSARPLAHLLLSSQPRPEGLIIGDDSLVSHAVWGLLDAGVQGNGQIDVVAHANFPYPPRAALPIHFIGFDIEKILELAFSHITRMRTGGEVPATTAIPVVQATDPIIAATPG
jgi:DNA-binding LacI/PurR family transcriptional regulator